MWGYRQPSREFCISASSLQKPSPCSQGRTWPICCLLFHCSASGKPLRKRSFWDFQLLATKIMFICANNELFSFRTFPSPQCMQSAIRRGNWAQRSQTLILLWRGWPRWQAALQVSSAPSVWSSCLWIEALKTTQCSPQTHHQFPLC